MQVRLCDYGCKAFESAVMGQQCDKAEHGTNTYSAKIKSLLSASSTKTTHNATGKFYYATSCSWILGKYCKKLSQNEQILTRRKQQSQMRTF